MIAAQLFIVRIVCERRDLCVDFAAGVVLRTGVLVEVVAILRRPAQEDRLLVRTGDAVAGIIQQQVPEQQTRCPMRVISDGFDCERHEVEHVAGAVVLPDARQHGFEVEFAQCASVVQVRRLKFQEVLEYLVTRHVHFHGRDFMRFEAAPQLFSLLTSTQGFRLMQNKSAPGETLYSV